MEMQDKLVILRNILYKCFFIGIAVLIFSMLIYFPYKNALSGLFQNIFGLSPTFYFKLWAIYMASAKMIIIFFFLIPALALHWSTCKCCNK